MELEIIQYFSCNFQTLLRIIVSYDVMPYSLVHHRRHFRDILMMKTVRSSETSVTTHNTTEHRTPQNGNAPGHYSKYLRPFTDSSE
jgi:hypothetical protein